MRVCFIAKVPSSAGVATKSAPIDRKTVQVRPEMRFQYQPNEILGINYKANEGNFHGGSATIVDFHSHQAPRKVGQRQTTENFQDHGGWRCWAMLEGD